MKLASFDIFDTVLIRKCGLPENIFYLLAHRLYPEDAALREDFLLWRKGAEARAQKRKSADVSLADIYEERTGAEIEKVIEAENLIANPRIKALIEKKRAEGWTICFISDMYLDSKFLGDVLIREGCLKDGEKVFVSCEHNARKSTGTLYDVVREELHPVQWMHWGDNRHSDVKMARRKGIQATRVDENFTDTERLLLQRSKQVRNSYELSILAGLQRAARVVHENTAFAEIAADFVASAYIPYVSFLLEDARRRGIKHLYFLSRDSHILMKLAEARAKDYPEIKFHYLFVSRKSLLMPYLAETGAEAYLAIQDRRTLLSKDVASLLQGLGTTREELANDFATKFDYDKISNKKQETDFLHRIFDKDSPYLPTLQQRAKERCELLLDYFKQEELLTGEKSAMVDVGWLGTSRLMINEILQRAGVPPVEFYYYGVRGDVLSSEAGVYTSYYRPEQLSTELTSLVENYYSASPYPSTLGYERTADGRVEPRFAEGSAYAETPITTANRSVLQWIYNEMLRTKLSFDAIFWDFSQVPIKAISALRAKINISAFAAAAEFDDTVFVRRLSLSETFKLVLLGDRITAFDAASLQLTCGRTLFPGLWRLHECTGRFRRRLYLKLKNR